MAYPIASIFDNETHVSDVHELAAEGRGVCCACGRAWLAFIGWKWRLETYVVGPMGSMYSLLEYGCQRKEDALKVAYPYHDMGRSEAWKLILAISIRGRPGHVLADRWRLRIRVYSHL